MKPFVVLHESWRPYAEEMFGPDPGAFIPVYQDKLPVRGLNPDETSELYRSDQLNET